jgi:hypothetical protein
MISWSRELDAVIPQEELGSVLEKNFSAACIRFSEDEVHGSFIPHVEAEFPEIVSDGFTDYLECKPLKLIETLKLLIRRKTFKGTCHIWIDW